MTARLVPVYFDPGRDQDFDKQLSTLQSLLADSAEILPPVALGQPLPEADAVVFPQLLGEAYRRVADFKALQDFGYGLFANEGSPAGKDFQKPLLLKAIDGLPKWGSRDAQFLGNLSLHQFRTGGDFSPDDTLL